MSGITPSALTEFRRLLRCRGYSLEQLAVDVGTTRSYVSRVLWGHLESRDTWKRIHALTTSEEWAILCTLENLATWNTEQTAAEKAGEWPWFMRSECGHCFGDRRFVPSCRAQARTTSHGICPPCLQAHFPEFAEEVRAKCALEQRANANAA